MAACAGRRAVVPRDLAVEAVRCGRVPAAAWGARPHHANACHLPRPPLPRLTPCLCSPDSTYSRHPWNLSVMPRQGGRHSTLLRVLDGNIAGARVHASAAACFCTLYRSSLLR